MWKRAAVLALFVLMAAHPTRAWDETGHKVVAYIAWQHMTPEARAAVAELLSNAPPRSNLLSLRPASGSAAGMLHFIRASYWPDIVRDPTVEERYARYHEPDWHYIDIYWEATSEDAVRIREDLEPADTNLVERLNRLEELARTDLVASAQKAVLIAWLAHLVGDVHQPLHASARVTELEPEGDRGGTRFELEGDDNLHLFWDRALTVAFERQVDESELEFIQRIASSLMSTNAPPPAFDGDYRAWADRSFRITSRDLYDRIERGEEPPVEYLEMAQATAAESVALAGFRLGELMNSIFG